MSDTPPKVTEYFTSLALASAPLIIAFILFNGTFEKGDALCLGTILFPILIIFLVIKLRDKYRENKPVKDTVQKLGLDDD